MKDDRRLSLGILTVVIGLLLIFGLLATGHVLLAVAVLVLVAAVGISELMQRRRPPEPGE